MKKTSLFKVSVLVMGIFSAIGASAADGTLNISGSTIAQGCQVRGEGRSNVVTDFGTVSPELFPTVGSISPKKEINFVLENCPASVTSVKVMPVGVAKNNIIQLNVGETAGTLGVAIYNKGGALIPPNTNSNSIPISADTHTANISLETALMSTAAVVKAGDISATAFVSFAYN